MPKRIATVSVTVVRDGKRINTGPGSIYAGKAFNYTDDEIKDVTAQQPTAFRKPVNEDPEPRDADAPENESGATADKTPKKDKATKAAEADSTSEDATKDGGKKPKSTKATPPAEGADEDDADEDEDI